VEKLTVAAAKKAGFTYKVIDKEVWIPQGHFAKWKGVSPITVTGAVQNKKIPPECVQKDGIRNWIRANAASDAWEKATDPVQQLKANIRNGKHDPNKQGTDPERLGAVPGYGESRAKREAIQAQDAQIELDEKMGKLVVKEQVQKEAYDVARSLRDALLAIPPRTADKIYGLQSPKDVLFFLDRELRECLLDFCERYGVENGPEGKPSAETVQEQKMHSNVPPVEKSP
jgi:phage terminase Nu1 subunit (DNA packaging protein)